MAPIHGTGVPYIRAWHSCEYRLRAHSIPAVMLVQLSKSRSSLPVCLQTRHVPPCWPAQAVAFVKDACLSPACPVTHSVCLTAYLTAYLTACLPLPTVPCVLWWACLESNQGPRPYQGRALTN